MEPRGAVESHSPAGKVLLLKEEGKREEVGRGGEGKGGVGEGRGGVCVHPGGKIEEGRGRERRGRGFLLKKTLLKMTLSGLRAGPPGAGLNASNQRLCNMTQQFHVPHADVFLMACCLDVDVLFPLTSLAS